MPFSLVSILRNALMFTADQSLNLLTWGVVVVVLALGYIAGRQR